MAAASANTLLLHWAVNVISEVNSHNSKNNNNTTTDYDNNNNNHNDNNNNNNNNNLAADADLKSQWWRLAKNTLFLFG